MPHFLKPKRRPVLSEKEKPAGRLSGVRANNRLFQVQTEFSTYPEEQIVTVVILEGKVVMKRKAEDLSVATDRKGLERLIEEQHIEVEKEVREKLGELARKK